MTVNLLLQWYSIGKLLNDKNNLETQIADLTNEADILHEEIEKLKDPEYIAAYARENYYYTKSGELVIKINKKEKNEETNKYTNSIINIENAKYMVIPIAMITLVIMISLYFL